ncbi:glycine/betaine ABC transporter substrate-binding protein [Petrotoga sp. 9PW.55.5.1]|uniref:glycine betaine ABC transporter substrate-binding protein n=1 Tax=Petrotoga sp. 9PW.55.5.1 TaxID=1308979 RepID=UPI000DC2BC34|nr:glycine betaine ABC transporter substrate-binding protein [Petrotoga sp. 9PW.55.5.1]RAO99662.1 glycine/betaine ABC transporter substrate-binding protein [Petrotoga sp. 9PW.55.5.1]
MRKILISTLIILFGINFIYAADKVVVGAKAFTEGYVLSSMVSLLLQENGIKVEEKFGLSSFPLRKAIETGQVDAYVDYTGTAWAAYFGHTENIYDPHRLFELVAQEDLEKHDIIWLDMINFNNTYGLAVRQSFARENNINTLSDLAEYINSGKGKDIIFGVNPEYYERSDGIFAVIDTYNIDIPKNKVRTMDAGLTYGALSKGNIDVAMIYSTDAQILRFDLKILEDDKAFFPHYNPSVLVRKEVLDKYPQIREILRPLTLYLNEDIIIRLNYLVDYEGLEPKNVARNYLRGLGLIK